MSNAMRLILGGVTLWIASITPTDAQEATPDPFLAIQRDIDQLSHRRFGIRQSAAARLVGEGSVVIGLIEDSAEGGDLDHAQRCVEILARIAKDPKTRQASLDSLDRLASRSAFPGAPLATKRAFQLRETQEDRAIRLLTLAGVRVSRSRIDKRVRSVYGVQSDRHCAHLRHLKGLRSVSLSGPGVTNGCFKYLTQVPDLDRLTVMRCSVTDRGLRDVGKIPKLRSVSLSGEFTAAGLKHLQDVKSLTSVAMFSAIGEPELRILSQLSVSSLFLSHVETSDNVVEILGKLKTVRSLSLTLHDATNDDLRWVKDSKIASLSLALEQSPGVTDEGLRNLVTPRLTSLRLNKSGVTSRGLATIGEITSLRTLSLQGTPLTDDDLKPLAQLDKLTSLTLLNTNVTEAGLETLKESMPSLRYVMNNLGVVIAPARPPR